MCAQFKANVGKADVSCSRCGTARSRLPLTGNRASLHNYLLYKLEKLFADKVEYRFMAPDPMDELTDAAWINETLSALIVLQGRN